MRLSPSLRFKRNGPRGSEKFMNIACYTRHYLLITHIEHKEIQLIMSNDEKPQCRRRWIICIYFWQDNSLVGLQHDNMQITRCVMLNIKNSWSKMIYSLLWMHIRMCRHKIKLIVSVLRYLPLISCRVLMQYGIRNAVTYDWSLLYGTIES